MNYPLISEYIEAIKSADDNFAELSYLRAVLGDDGLPIMTSGNFAVVFKMKDETTGKLYALKCFTKEQQGREEAYHQIAEELKNVDSPYLVSLRYLEKELFVDTEQTDETEFPVLLMDWVEGKTLDKYLRENLDKKYALEMLAYRFSQLAQWLIPQNFAHGDLKPDNILVREDGTLVLVDYDGMYVPAMKGQNARELGSPDFRHPLRTENDFDEHVDDFSIVSILLSLLITSQDVSLWNKYTADDRLLFSSDDYRNFSNCSIINDLPKNDVIINELTSILLNLCNNNTCVYNKLPTIAKPVDKGYSMEVTFCKIESSFPIIGGKRFLEGVTSIGNDYCSEKNNIKNIEFPRSLKTIEPFAYSGCTSLLLTNIENTSLVTIKEWAFSNCCSLGYISLPSSLRVIGSYAFEDCAFKLLTIPENVNIIGDYAFAGCSELHQIKLPRSISSVGKSIFKNCNSLKYVIIPKGSKNKYCQLMSEYEQLFLVEGSLKYYLNLWRIIDEDSYAESYYINARDQIDPRTSFLNHIYRRKKYRNQ